jgi:hypothetical protein
MVPARHILRWCLGVALMGALSGCGGGDTTDDTRVVASYRDKQLTRAMLNHYLPKASTPADSTRYADAFVKQWLKEQAVMDEALQFDPELAQEVEYKVQDYRAKLIMHSYQNRIIEESLDRNVSKKEIRTFYEANKQNFIATERLYCYYYVATSKADNNQVGEWMLRSRPEDLTKLQEWVATNAHEYKVDSSYVNEAKMEHVSKGFYGSLEKSPVGKLIRWNGVIRGEKRYYLFKMVDVVEPEQPMSLELCRDKIIELILNDRKLSIIEKNEERILNNARSNKYIN